MQKKYIILPIILSLFSLLSAGAPDTLWTRVYGDTAVEGGYSIQQTSDGGFIIAGRTNSFGAGGYDVYLIRTNSNSDTLWTRTYGGASGDEGHSVQHTNDSGYIIVGSSMSFGASDFDVYLIRTNPNGDTLWTKTYGNTLSNYGYSVQQTDDGGFIIAGATWLSGIGSGSDAYVIRTDSEGDTLWTKTYSGPDDSTYESGRSVQQTSDGGFVIIGNTFEEDSTNTIDNFWYVYLIRTDSNGDTLFTKTYGGENFDWAQSGQQTSDGGFIIVGETSTDNLYSRDVYLIRINSNGDTLWTRMYGGAKNDGGYSIQQTSDGGFIIAGRTSSFGAGGFDVYLIRTNSNGDSLWTKTLGGAYGDEGKAVLQTSDGGFIVAGFTEPLIAFKSDVYLIRLEPEVGIQDLPKNFIEQNNFTVSYNYANNLISIRYTIPYYTHVKLEIYDIQGRLIKVITDKFMNKGSHSVNWDSKKFGSGVYYIKLTTGNNTLIRKAIIIK